MNRDPRRFYFGALIALLVVVSVFIHLQLPARLLAISANMSALGMLVFPWTPLVAL